MDTQWQQRWPSNEYRHNYQSGNQDYYSNNGYADRHGYMLDSQWNESPQDSPPDLDFGYYLSKILQIPDMRDQQQQHYYYQQQQHQQHMQQQQQHLESPLDMPIPTSNMQRMHKRVTFGNPIATIADIEPVSMTDPVSLLSWKPHKRKDFAKYTDESHAASSAKIRRRKSDYGPQMSVADGSAKPFKQYRYDDRFSLSMEHLPLYNNLPSS
ncbi:hypothetical protein GGI06_001856 [Coemansia sp. S85]|nr:hypothetical protein GGI06_001856 [Coemansia sp. S85]